MDNIERLMMFGLTRQEAVIYTTLYKQGEMTGYEAAKITGISRSNTYGSLAALVDKGAAYIMEGNTTRYTPVDITEFCQNILNEMQSTRDVLAKSMPDKKDSTEGYITICGEKNILNKLKYMINQTDERIYLSLSKNLIELISEDLLILARKGIKVVLISDEVLNIPGIRIYQTDNIAGQLRVIVDSKYVLTGDFDGESSNCLYSSKKNLIDVFKDALRNEMKLIEITKGAL